MNNKQRSNCYWQGIMQGMTTNNKSDEKCSHFLFKFQANGKTRPKNVTVLFWRVLHSVLVVCSLFLLVFLATTNSYMSWEGICSCQYVYFCSFCLFGELSGDYNELCCCVYPIHDNCILYNTASPFYHIRQGLFVPRKHALTSTASLWERVLLKKSMRW